MLFRSGVRGVLPGADNQPRLKDTTGNHKVFRHLSATYEIHDFDFVAVVDDRAVVGGLLDDGEVEFDGDATRIDVEVLEQRADAQGTGNVVWIAVESNSTYTG